MSVARHPADGLLPQQRRVLLGELLRRRATLPDSFPLSFAQQRLWLVEQIEPGLATHHVFRAFHLRGPLRIPALAAGVGGLVARHEALRTSFRPLAGAARQVVAAAASVDLPLVDVSRLCAEERERAIRDLAASECAHPFDLSARRCCGCAWCGWAGRSTSSC